MREPFEHFSLQSAFKSTLVSLLIYHVSKAFFRWGLITSVFLIIGSKSGKVSVNSVGVSLYFLIDFAHFEGIFLRWSAKIDGKASGCFWLKNDSSLLFSWLIVSKVVTHQFDGKVKKHSISVNSVGGYLLLFHWFCTFSKHFLWVFKCQDLWKVAGCFWLKNDSLLLFSWLFSAEVLTKRFDGKVKKHSISVISVRGHPSLFGWFCTFSKHFFPLKRQKWWKSRWMFLTEKLLITCVFLIICSKASNWW